MHIKTNIEHNIVQIVVLAICPLLLVLNNLNQAFFYIFSTTICYLISAIVCKFFNKYLDSNLKIFVTAVLSTFVMTILNFMLKKHTIMSLEANEDIYYTVLATICLCLDTYFVDKKSETKLYLFKVLFDCIVFAVMILILTIFVEIFTYGTLFKLTIIKGYTENAFFRGIIFKLVVLGVLCVIFDFILRKYQAKKYEKKIVYEKYVRKIRDEKFFQYDELRRKKLLVSKVEVNKVTEEELEEINQKIAENEKVELEGDEVKVAATEDEKNRNEEIKNKLNNRSKNVKKETKDKNKNSSEERSKDKAKDKAKTKEKKKKENLKGSSRGAKVERVFTKEDRDDKE